MMSENTTIDASAVGPEPRTRKVRGFIRRLALNRRSLSLVDQAVVSVTNMGTSVIVGRTCAKEQLGLYASGLSLILLLIAIQAALITVPYTISNPRIPKLEHPLYKAARFSSRYVLCLLECSSSCYLESSPLFIAATN